MVGRVTKSLSASMVEEQQRSLFRVMEGSGTQAEKGPRCVL
jgi:hypothetical protein